MDRLKHIAEMGDFIPHGDDSFIDDDGITNRWAQRRRANRARLDNQVVQGTYTLPVPDQPLHVPPANEIYQTNNPEVLDAIRDEQERMNREMARLRLQARIADNHQLLTDLAHQRVPNAENTDPELRDDLERLYRQMFRDI